MFLLEEYCKHFIQKLPWTVSEFKRYCFRQYEYIENAVLLRNTVHVSYNIKRFRASGDVIIQTYVHPPLLRICN